MTALLLAALAFASTPDDRATVIVAIGAPGADEYAPQFAEWAARWRTAAERGQADVIVIGHDASSEASTAGDASDLNRLRKALAELTPGESAPVWIVLIGHGTFDGRVAKFNLKGPDLSVDDLKSMLAPIQRPVVLVDCSSASGPFLSGLSAKGRAIVTATRSGDEINFARFGDSMSVAIADPASDLDKDDQVSLLEAFLTASKRVEEFYKTDGRLATEHALIDDNGDGLGTPADWFRGVRATKRAKDGAELDGTRSRQLHLVPNAREFALSAEARARRDELELALEQLRGQKAGLAEDEYYRQLKPILVELSRIYQSGQEATPESASR
jgi:hypothetical protein